MTLEHAPQPVPQIGSTPSATNDILWDQTVADYKTWRKAFYAPSHVTGAGWRGQQAQEEIELNLLKAILQSNRLAGRVVDTYLYLIECRPREVVDPFSKSEPK